MAGELTAKFCPVWRTQCECSMHGTSRRWPNCTSRRSLNLRRSVGRSNSRRLATTRRGTKARGARRSKSPNCARARACYAKCKVEREECRAVLANLVDGLMSEKRELYLLNVPELPRASPRRRRRRRLRRTIRGTVVVALLATGIIALLVTGIIAYWPSSDRLRANNSAIPPTAFEVARDAEQQSRN